MKNLFDGEHKKSKIALAAVLVGALVLPLCSCGMGGIEGKAPYAPTLGKLTKLLPGNLTLFNKSIFRQF